MAKEWRSVNDLYFSKTTDKVKAKPEQPEEEHYKNLTNFWIGTALLLLPDTAIK